MGPRNRPFMLLSKRTLGFFSKPTYSVVKPHSTSPQISPSSIPKDIPLPPYAHSGIPFETPPEYIGIKNASQIEAMQRAGRIARSILESSRGLIAPGVTTDEIDKALRHLCFHEYKVYPSPLNYRSFPKSICTSINNVACHGIPDDRPLQDGDILNVDITVYTKDKVHGDCSMTFPVGEIDEEAKALLKVAEKALWKGIEEVSPQRPIHCIGRAIEAFVKPKGYSIIPIFTGHGIGIHFHEPPDIYHFNYEDDLLMVPGMIFTIEPIVSEKSNKVRILPEDGWTAISLDNSRSAQFEHTILVTESGYEVLTQI